MWVNKDQDEAEPSTSGESKFDDLLQHPFRQYSTKNLFLDPIEFRSGRLHP